MLISIRSYSTSEWRRWFAWRPVIVHTDKKYHIAWLVVLERNGPWEFMGGWNYDYRFIECL